MTTTCQSNANDYAADQAPAEHAGQNQDTNRRWIWWFLAVVAASQLYFVRELVAAFALFAIAFVAITFVVASLYMLTKAWGLAVSRLAELRHPVMTAAAVTAEHHKAA